MVKATENLKKLYSLLSEFELFQTIIKGSKEVTIFAPSDEAFAKLSTETLEGLTREDKEKILARHIIAVKKIPSAGITNGQQVSTLLLEKIMLLKSDEGGVQIYYNGKLINIVTADKEASNGVIHIIDKVIL